MKKKNLGREGAGGEGHEALRVRQKHRVFRQPSMHGRRVYLAVLPIAVTKYLAMGEDETHNGDGD